MLTKPQKNQKEHIDSLMLEKTEIIQGREGYHKIILIGIVKNIWQNTLSTKQEWVAVIKGTKVFENSKYNYWHLKDW